MKDINLLPEEIKSTTPYERSKVVGISAKGVLVVIVVLLVFGATLLIPRMYVKSLEMNLEGIEAQIKNQKYNEVRTVRTQLSLIDGKLSTKKNVMDTIDNMNISVNEIITAVKSAIPKECQINSVSADQSRITVTGTYRDNIAIAELLANINRIDYVTFASDVKFPKDNTFQVDLKVTEKAVEK